MIEIPAAYVSRPVIEIDGKERARVSRTTVSAFAEETTAGLSRCEIVLNNIGPTDAGVADYLYFDRETVDFGQEIILRLGPGDPPEQVFTGLVTALEATYPAGGGSQLVVLAEDRFQNLRMTRRSRTFEDVTDADVITQVARDHDLTPEVNLDGPTHRVLAQLNLSDLAFIRERARALGAELWLEGETLHADTRTDRTGNSMTLAYGANLITFGVRADLAHQCTSLRVSGWDVQAKEAIKESADQAALNGELDGDQSGSAILSEALGDRVASVVHTTPLTSDEARREAQARYRARARRFVTGTGLADGHPQLRVGRTVSLTGLGSLFDGDYYVVRARHTYDRTDGYRTEFDVERPGIGS
jgi:phage protein D